MMTLANSLKRIWSAKNRVPHLTGWGTYGSLESSSRRNTQNRWVVQRILQLVAIARRTAPTVFVIAYNIFR